MIIHTVYSEIKNDVILSVDLEAASVTVTTLLPYVHGCMQKPLAAHCR